MAHYGQLFLCSSVGARGGGVGGSDLLFKINGVGVTLASTGMATPRRGLREQELLEHDDQVLRGLAPHGRRALVHREAGARATSILRSSPPPGAGAIQVFVAAPTKRCPSPLLLRRHERHHRRRRRDVDVDGVGDAPAEYRASGLCCRARARARQSDLSTPLPSRLPVIACGCARASPPSARRWRGSASSRRGTGSRGGGAGRARGRAPRDPP